MSQEGILHHMRYTTNNSKSHDLPDILKKKKKSIIKSTKKFAAQQPVAKKLVGTDIK